MWVVHTCYLVTPMWFGWKRRYSEERLPVLSWLSQLGDSFEGETLKTDSVAPPAGAELLLNLRRELGHVIGDDVLTHVGLVVSQSPRQWAGWVMPQSGLPWKTGLLW